MKKSVTREYYEAILVAFILALFVRTFVFENFKIPSGSMEDNLLIGDHLVVNKFMYGHVADTALHALLPYRDPRRGDVVVFKWPEDPRRDFIKRCVAIAGDTVEMREQQLYLNGTPVDEPFVVHKRTKIRDTPGSGNRTWRFRNRDNFGPYTVPDGHIFCLGDNRDNSSDSRYWGPVPVSYVKGRAVLIYWSYEAESGDWEWRGVWHRARQLEGVVLNFFTKPRWSRQFKLVE